MPGAIDTVPARLRNLPSVQKLATSVDRSRKDAREAKAQSQSGRMRLMKGGTVTSGAAFTAGVIDSTTPKLMEGVENSTIAGFLTLGAAAWSNNPMLADAAIGFLAVSAYKAGEQLGDSIMDRAGIGEGDE